MGHSLNWNLDIGTTITDGIDEVLDEAAQTLSETMSTAERLYIRGLKSRIELGELSLFTLISQNMPVGIMCYKNMDSEAELIFGYIMGEFRGSERYFLERVIGALSTVKVNVVRTGFSWPGAEEFRKAAMDIGFVEVERKSMVRGFEGGPIHSENSYNGVNILPWCADYLDSVCRIMCDAAIPVDKVVYPLFASYTGSRKLLLSILQDKHGTFLPEHSFIASIQGKIVGFVISSLMADGSILILDIAVAKEYRRMGIGSRMLEYLIGKRAVTGNGQIVLAVTSQNHDAIRLYRRMGFREVSTFRQYVLSPLRG